MSSQITRPLVAAASTAGLALALSTTATVGAYGLGTVLTPGSESFAFTGASADWVVPAGVCSLTVFVAGASGGASSTDPTTQLGGLGGTVSALVSVQPGDLLTVTVGGVGSSPHYDDPAATGGFGGGGAGAALANGTVMAGGGGGGASTVQLAGAPVIIAGGGGGAGASYADSPVSGGAGGQEGVAGFGGDSIGGGLGGGNGGAGGAGGSGGVGTEGVGDDGQSAVGQRGGDGGNAALYDGPSDDPHTGRGGGGGGGATGGGGGGGAGIGEGAAGGGGGGGGSSMGPANATFATGTQAGDGAVTISYDESSACVAATASAPTLPRTGVDSTSLLGVVAVAVTAGLGLIAAGRARRRNSAS